MAEERKKEPLLTPLRVLDLTTDRGYLCGKILADLGTDVIKIEPPGGDPGRRIGPFYHDIPDPEKSLYWFAYNINKRSITLNIETKDGQEIFKRLVTGADFVVESFDVGYLDKLGLGYSALSKLNPHVIMASISPFGQTGPYSGYKGSDIVCMAMSGLMYQTGYPDAPPMRVSFPQMYFHASAQAAAGMVMAYYYRGPAGEGQYIDAAAFEWLNFLASIEDWSLAKRIVPRIGVYRLTSRKGKPSKDRNVWKCKDGYVAFGGARSGSMMGPGTRALVEWIDSEGMAPDPMKKIEWITFDMSAIDDEFAFSMENAISEFLMKHTKEELLAGSLKRRILLFPVDTAEDIRENPILKEQLETRKYWVDVDHPELETKITYPGAFYLSSETACVANRRAPLIGEHNEEIYGAELGFSKEKLVLLKQAGVI